MAFGLVCPKVFGTDRPCDPMFRIGCDGEKVKYYLLKNREHARVNAIWQ
jgi:hypothetical protein